MRITMLLCSIFLFPISGCMTTSVAKDPIEYRQQITQSPGARNKIEKYQVNRSFSAITSTLQKKSKECLNYSFDRNFSYAMSGATGSNVSHITYKPKIITSKIKTELYVQMNITGDVYLSYTPPKDGVYILVADITSVENNKSQVDLYYNPYKAEILPTAIKSWIKGNDTGCPDLQKDMASES